MIKSINETSYEKMVAQMIQEDMTVAHGPVHEISDHDILAAHIECACELPPTTDLINEEEVLSFLLKRQAE
jgi:hypothetical protein